VAAQPVQRAAIRGRPDTGVNPNSVVINQILTNTTGASGQAIELYNTTLCDRHRRLYLSDLDTTTTDLKKYKIPG